MLYIVTTAFDAYDAHGESHFLVIRDNGKVEFDSEEIGTVTTEQREDRHYNVFFNDAPIGEVEFGFGEFTAYFPGERHAHVDSIETAVARVVLDRVKPDIREMRGYPNTPAINLERDAVLTERAAQVTA